MELVGRLVHLCVIVAYITSPLVAGEWSFLHIDHSSLRETTSCSHRI